MKESLNYKIKLPEQGDNVDIDVISDGLKKIDIEMKSNKDTIEDFKDTKNKASGLCGLDQNSKIPNEFIPLLSRYDVLKSEKIEAVLNATLLLEKTSDFIVDLDNYSENYILIRVTLDVKSLRAYSSFYIKNDGGQILSQTISGPSSFYPNKNTTTNLFAIRVRKNESKHSFTVKMPNEVNWTTLTADDITITDLFNCINVNKKINSELNNLEFGVKSWTTEDSIDGEVGSTLTYTVLGIK